MTVELDVYFAADEAEANSVGLKYMAEEYYSISTYKFINKMNSTKVNLTEVVSVADLSKNINKDDYFLYGTDGDVTIHQCLLKAFL